MNQGRGHGAYRRLEAEAIDLGNEPPLAVDGGTGGLVDRRRLSVQWFTGTILAGLCGAALMGGAVFASLDGETSFASAPERAENALRGALSSAADRLIGLHRTDRLPMLSEPNVARQLLRVPTSTRVRDRELVRTHSYTRVSGNLSLSVSELSANIPPFNPQKLLADGAANDDRVAAEPDAEVSFVTCDFVPAGQKGKSTAAACDLNSLLPKVKAATQLSLDEVTARVREVAAGLWVNPSLLANAESTTGRLKLNYAPENEADPYAGFEARVIPENITMLPKRTGGSDWSEHVVGVTKKGETVGSILRELGATPDEIKALVAVLGRSAGEGGLREGQQLRVLTVAAGLGHMQPLRVMVVSDSAIEAAAALSDNGTYVPVDIRNVDADVSAASEGAERDESPGVTLYRSLYETALRDDVPISVVDEMVRIYSYDVDFQRKVQPGDGFDVLYADDDTGEGRKEVRYVSLTVSSDTKKYYRYRTADDGAYDYYDETGKSAKKFLVRKPVPIGIMRSGFGVRNHPLLHYMQMHTGVDWAAPLGTPIFAAGNGTIDEIGVKGGYGKYVRIRHANGYQTAYGHMTAFARGLNVGSRVRQGQVIGFVGSTGLSTGDHVHFEILVNNHFVNPMTIKLPRGRVLDGTSLALFERDRDQLDTLMARSPAHLAQAH